MPRVRSKKPQKKAIESSETVIHGVEDLNSTITNQDARNGAKGKPKTEKEEELEKLIFGDLQGFNEALDEDIDEYIYDKEGQDDQDEGALVIRTRDEGEDFTALEDQDVRVFSSSIVTETNNLRLGFKFVAFTNTSISIAFLR